MFRAKTILIATAKLLRGAAFVIGQWYWIALALCIISPVSLHIKIPHELSYSDCAYIGTRGLVRPDAVHCPLAVIIDTRNGEAVSW